MILWPGQCTTPGVAYGLPYMDDMPGRFYRALAQVKLHGRLNDLGIPVIISEEDDLRMILLNN